MIDNTKENQIRINEFGEKEVRCISHKQKHEFTPDETFRIILSYQSGQTTKKISEEFGCCRTTISKLLKEHGVNVTRAKEQAKLPDNQVISMYAQMHTSEEIGAHFGVTPQVVIACLKRNGISIRTRWDYHKKAL